MSLGDPEACATTVGMKRLGHIFAVLAFALALVMGAAGGVMAHDGTMDHQSSHHAPTHQPPVHGDHHKAALLVVAPCCPAAEAPAKAALAAPVTMAEVSWAPRPTHIPDARDIAPEPHPPKSSL
ncbi:hypothetical protein [Azospirillum sp. sgz301742]